MKRTTPAQVVRSSTASVFLRLRALGVLLLFALSTPGSLGAEVFLPEQAGLLGLSGVAVDADGMVYVSDTQACVVRKYTPDGTPLTVFGREYRPGPVSGPAIDGSPVDVRFRQPALLAMTPEGHVLVIDGDERIRRINRDTLETTTLLSVRDGVDASSVYDVVMDEFRDLGTLSSLRLADIAASPNGTLFASASDLQGVLQYLLRDTGGGWRVFATSIVPVQTVERARGRGMTVDSRGNVFVQFPSDETRSGAGELALEIVYRFRGGSAADVTKHQRPAEIIHDMAAGLGDGLYYTSGIPGSAVVMISASRPGVEATELAVAQRVTAQQVRALAVGPQGALYAGGYHTVDDSGVPTPSFSKVDRFPGLGTPVGAASGDTVPPTVRLTSPLGREVVVAPGTLRADAADDGGLVSVEFRLDDRPLGVPLSDAPFQVTLDPAAVPAGNHTVYAVARDPAGNAAVSGLGLVRTVGGPPGTDGELFSPKTVNTAPVGIATDPGGNVYVAYPTEIHRLSPEAELETVYGAPESAHRDGSPAEVRFGRLRGLGSDAAGGILVVDDPEPGAPSIRRLDPATGETVTVAVLDRDLGIDITNVFDVATSTFQDLPATASLCDTLDCSFQIMGAYDAVGAPNGDILVAGSRGDWILTDSSGYLLRLGAGGNTALARSPVAYSWSSGEYQKAPGVAVDAEGAVFAHFPEEGVVNADHDALWQFDEGFPAGGATAAHRLFSPLTGTGGLVADRGGRLYMALDSDLNRPGRVEVLSTAGGNQLVQSLAKQLLDQVHDVALDAEGNVYVTSSEIRSLGNVPYIVGQVTRFTGVASMAGVNRPPVLRPVGPQIVDRGAELRFEVFASDPDGEVPGLSAHDLPAGASFTDRGDGSGLFVWSTGDGDEGSYAVTFTATDSGSPSVGDSVVVTIVVGRPGRDGLVFGEHPDAGTQIEVSFAGDSDASPVGWLTEGFLDGVLFTTAGNNAVAGENRGVAANSSDIETLPYMIASPTDEFRFDFENAYETSGGQDIESDRDAAIVNAFYWANLMHDRYYTLGFDEAAGNYQSDNFGKGGIGGDPVYVHIHYGWDDPGQRNNAFFYPRRDGNAGLLSLLLFTADRVRNVDPAFDAEVIIHEYTHGVTNRVCGGATSEPGATLRSAQGGAMGEGWSDWFAASYLEDAVAGEYISGNADTGIRVYPLDDNPMIYSDFAGEVHRDGELWSATLWDLRDAFVGRYGTDPGRIKVEQLVFDAIALAPPEPSMLEMRDFTLLVDRENDAAANHDLIWQVFAARGMGLSASTTGPNDLTPEPAFDVPALPTATLSVEPTTITLGEAATLTWSSTNASACILDPGLRDVDPVGTLAVTPQVTTTFTLFVEGTHGRAESSVEVVVEPPAGAPTVTLTATPGTLAPGESATLSWTSRNADAATLDGVGAVETTGTRTVSPSETTPYTITARGPGGAATATATVTVEEPPPPAPTVSLIATPASIVQGAESTLSWSSTGATTATLEPGPGSVAVAATLEIAPTETTTYTITVEGPGGTATASTTVTVTPVTPAPTVTLTAAPQAIVAGETSTLSWQADNAATATLEPGPGGVEVAATLEVAPTETTTYTITVEGPGGTATASTTVTVAPVTPAPTVTLTATPGMVTPGGTATLSWSSTHATDVSIAPQIGPVDPSGFVEITPAETTTFTATAVGAGGTATATATVTVMAMSTTAIPVGPVSIVPADPPVALSHDTVLVTTAGPDGTFGFGSGDDLVVRVSDRGGTPVATPITLGDVTGDTPIPLSATAATLRGHLITDVLYVLSDLGGTDRVVSLDVPNLRDADRSGHPAGAVPLTVGTGFALRSSAFEPLAVFRGLDGPTPTVTYAAVPETGGATALWPIALSATSGLVCFHDHPYEQTTSTELDTVVLLEGIGGEVRTQALSVPPLGLLNPGPTKLSATSALFPSAGADGMLGTGDDAVAVLQDLGNANRVLSVPVPGIMSGASSRPVRLSASRALVSTQGSDGEARTGDDAVVLLTGLDTASPAVVPLAVGGLARAGVSRPVAIDTRTAVVATFGAERWDSFDDSLAILSDLDGGTPSTREVVVGAPGRGGFLYSAARPPALLSASRLMYPSPGPDYEYTSDDDQLILIDDLGGENRIVPIPVPFCYSAHDFSVPVALSGTRAVTVAAGPDGAYGSQDDELVWVQVPGSGETLEWVEIAGGDIVLDATAGSSQVHVSGHFADGSQRDLTASTSGTEYATSDARVATVSAEGLVAALAPGVATLSARNQGLTARIQVTVLPGEQCFTFERTAPDLAAGITFTAADPYLSLEYSAGADASADVTFQLHLNGRHVVNVGPVAPNGQSGAIPLPNNVAEAGANVVVLQEPYCTPEVGSCVDGTVSSWGGQVCVTARAPEEVHWFEVYEPDLDYTFFFSAAGAHTFRYASGPRHVTPVTFDLYLNGAPVQRVGPVPLGGDSGLIGLPADAMVGENTLELRNPSCPAGTEPGQCEGGILRSWGGTVSLVAGEAPPAAPIELLGATDETHTASAW